MFQQNRPDNLSKGMTRAEFDEYFGPIVSIRFDRMRSEAMSNIYYAALMQFPVSIWREVAMEFALSDSKEWPKPGYFTERCRAIRWEKMEALTGKVPTYYTDAECYCPAALKARSEFFRKINETATRLQPGEGTFLRALNSAITDQVEAMEKVVKKNELAK